MFYPKHTIVPFMLYALPKIKSFGNITLVHALRMIRAIPALNGIKAENLEELEYIQNGLDFYRSDFAWASDEIYDMVDEFMQAVFDRWPNVVVQFEDFESSKAPPLA